MKPSTFIGLEYNFGFHYVDHIVTTTIISSSKASIPAQWLQKVIYKSSNKTGNVWPNLY
jgi:hypothetical protein